MASMWTGHCVVDVEAVPLWAMMIGCLSLPCLFIGPSFQYVKFYRTKSAEGVSALTLGIGSIARGLVVVNLIILHYDQMVTCYGPHKPNPGVVNCQASFLVLYSGIGGFLAYFPQYIVAKNLIDGERNPVYRNQATWGGYLIISALVCVALPVAAAMKGNSCESAEGYAVAIGFVSTIFLCLQFTPQLYTSLVLKTAGSMSYLTYGLDVIGGIIILQAKIFGTREDISTWLPTLIMHLFEAVIVGVNLYHDYYHGRLKGSLLAEAYFIPRQWLKRDEDTNRTDNTEKAPLLSGVGTASPILVHSKDKTASDTEPDVTVEIVPRVLWEWN
mmetsp:Transcript_50083/g.95668  ORF Transcript_50083/g.95668 Transcript_50083/m.95668 type:complete len:329 (+) Transcript_50083:525-1511(+)